MGRETRSLNEKSDKNKKTLNEVISVQWLYLFLKSQDGSWNKV